jgi:hypothetical protein
MDGRLPLHRLLKPSIYPDRSDATNELVISKWDIDISDKELEYSEANTAARRPDAAGNNLAALARITGELRTLTATLVTSSPGDAPMSFGIAQSDVLAAGSPNFGREYATWGITELPSDDKGSVGGSGAILCKFRKLRGGDKFNIKYNRVEGKASLKINDGELFQEFQLHEPGGCRGDYVMGAGYYCVSF